MRTFANLLNNGTHAQGTPSTFLCIASGNSSTCTMCTLCVKQMNFMCMLCSVCSRYAPCMLPPCPLRQCWGKPSCHLGPTSSCTWSILVCVTTQKHVFLFIYVKKYKNTHSSKIKWIRDCYLYLCMSILMVWASLEHRGSLSLHRDIHIWPRYVYPTSGRIQVGRV